MDNFDFMAFIEYMGKPTGYVILGLLVLWLLNKVKILPLGIDWIANKVDKKRASLFIINNVKSLEVHSVFHELKAWKTRKVKNLNFGDPIRNIIFRDILLKNKIKVIEESLSNTLIKCRHMNDMNVKEFHAMVSDQVDYIITKYNKDILTDLTIKFESEKKGKEIFEYVMNSPIKGFNQQHEKVVSFLLHIIDDVCTTVSIYDNNVERYWSILNAYAAALTSTFVDIEKTYTLYNGDLEKIIEG